MVTRTRRRLVRIGVAVAVTSAALAWLAVVDAGSEALRSPAASAGQVMVPGLDGVPVEPFAPARGIEATVLLFVMTDCPISNRYAPEIRRLHDEFAGTFGSGWSTSTPSGPWTSCGSTIPRSAIRSGRCGTPTVRSWRWPGPP